MGWPLLYETPLGMICLYRKVMTQLRLWRMELSNHVIMYTPVQSVIPGSYLPFQYHKLSFDWLLLKAKATQTVL